MKLKSIFTNALIAGALVGIVGCSTPVIQVSMNVAGEVKLNGVSKIALADFNTIPGDAFTGTMSADKETCALVKRAVASAFYVSPMYQIVDMDAEDLIAKNEGARPKKRYDAVIYGRLWWQVTPESSGKYPHKYTLETWKNVPYTIQDPITKKPIQKIAQVTEQKRDVVEMLDYCVRNATLMLTLSIYRLEASGDLVKIVDTYQVSNQGFSLMNGELKLDLGSVGVKNDGAVARLQATGKDNDSRTAYEEMFVPKQMTLADAGKALSAGLSALGDSLKAPAEEEEKPKDGRKVDANGKLILTQNSVAMPTELQAKLMLASSVSSGLAAKLAPSKATFDIPAKLGDTRLENLLKNGAFQSAQDYAMYMLRNKLGKQVCHKLARFLPEFDKPAPYPVPDSEKQLPDYNEALIDKLLEADFNIYFYALGTAHEAAKALEDSAKCTDAMLAYLASAHLDTYFYSLGVCNEATQKLDEAQEYYRFAFNARPSSDAALGLSRTWLALGETDRLKKTKKARNKAAKKTNLE